MIINLLEIALLVAAGSAAAAPVDKAAFQGLNGKTAAELIPGGWQLVADGEARGDLNGDGKADLALVVEEKKPPARRALTIFFADGHGGFRFAALGPKAVLQADAGGALGDPFAGVEIDKKRVLTVSFYGGASLRWGLIYKWRYDDGSFHLIGSTHEAFDAAGPETSKVTVDTNYLTGRYDVVTTLSKPKAVKGAVFARPARIGLDRFEAGSGSEPHVTAVLRQME